MSEQTTTRTKDDPTVQETVRDNQVGVTTHSRGEATILESDRPGTVASPNVVGDTRTATTMPVDPMVVDEAAAASPTVPPQEHMATSPGGTNWSTILTAIGVIVLVLLLIAWIF